MSLQRFTAGFDLHGDRQDRATVKAFFEFDAAWKPHIRILGGDLIDLRPLRKGADAKERAESMRADIDSGRSFLKRWRPNWWIRGNHCERLWEHAQDTTNGIVADMCGKGTREFETLCRIHRIKMLPYHKRENILMLTPRFGILHGFYHGKYAAKQHAEVYGSVLFGHTHRIMRHPVAGLDRRYAMNCGCLCDTDMSFEARRPETLTHENGWAYGVINTKTGAYQAWQAEKMEDTWLLPTDLKTIG